jgi:hypothetical protein
MKINELEVGMKVQDTWFPNWGVGVVTLVLKTRVIVKFSFEDRTYDKNHTQFLKRAIK